MLFVPKGSAFFVLGEVNKAGTFPLDKEVSILEAITLAGGFSNTAAPSGVKILRRAPDGKQETIALDMSGAVPKDKNFRLEDGERACGNAHRVAALGLVAVEPMPLDPAVLQGVRGALLERPHDLEETV